MATDQLDHLIKEAKQLSVDELKLVSELLFRLDRFSVDDLKAVSERLLDEIADREWKALFSKPEAKQTMRVHGRKAWQEHLAGQSEEGGFDGE